MEYTRRDLALAYLEAYPVPEHHEVDPESLYARMKTYHRQLLRGLKQLFGFDLNDDQLLKFFFRSVAYSYRGNRHPLSGVLEGGLLVKRFEGTDVMDRCVELATLHERTQERLVDLTVEILALAKPDDGTVVTTEQLQAIGVDTAEPTDPDGDWL
ncbi:hypothetical protein AB0A63_26295 [Lentzea sp. NPDC042327]|uniref:hypothetical protein n=1 Tax=Lentzea sp. NPDC042327 TaxID=3154801 RepID=UPI0033CC9876